MHPEIEAFAKLAQLAFVASEKVEELSSRPLGDEPTARDLSALESELCFDAARDAALRGDHEAAVAAFRTASRHYDEFLACPVR